MKYLRKKSNNLYLYDTPYENIFINEFIATSPGEYVKVYLYAYMCMKNGISMDISNMARELQMIDTDIIKAWRYWESNGVVEIVEKSGGIDFDIVFFSLKEKFYGLEEDTRLEDTETFVYSQNQAGGTNDDSEIKKNNQSSQINQVSQTDQNINLSPPLENIENKKENQISDLDSKNYNNLQNLAQILEKEVERPIDTGEFRAILSMINNMDISKDLIIYAYSYCKDKGKSNFNYIRSVIENWTREGLKEPIDVEAHMAKRSERNNTYSKILKSLGMNRMPTEGEIKIMKRWIDDLGFSIDKILEACDKTTRIREPNINYVNTVLMNWYKDAKKKDRNVNEKKPVSQKVLDEYYSYLREKAIKQKDERTKEVYELIPAIEQIDRKINSLGFQISKSLLTNTVEENKAISEKISELEETRAIMLLENNKEYDYTELKYLCGKCQDTGVTDSGACDCVKDRAVEAEQWIKERNF